MFVYPGAEDIFDKEINVKEYGALTRAKRRDLKSATAKNLYDNVIAKHNKDVRITSAKN